MVTEPEFSVLLWLIRVISPLGVTLYVEMMVAVVVLLVSFSIRIIFSKAVEAVSASST